MTLTAGSKLGPYEIVAPLGAGGMGEVYRVRGARLAVKIFTKARFDCSHSQTKLAGKDVESATAQWILADRVVGS